mgnify:CR=1 FL=1|jgi:uncharacterized protein YnzC (UPF0291/DUF896 family)
MEENKNQKEPLNRIELTDEGGETERLKKINLLAHKAKTIGLTPEEEKEREKLRKEYIEAFKKRTRKQIEKIVFVDEKGNETPIKRKQR